MIYLHEPIESPGAKEAAGEQARRVFRRGRLFSHLMADTEEELREFALSVGLPLKWIQKPGTAEVHFDITGRWYNTLKHNPRVHKCTIKEWVDWLREHRKKERKERTT